MNLELSSIPIIVISCYLAGELFKLFFIKWPTGYKYIPIITSILGGLLGILIFYTGRNLINSAKTVYDAFLIGVISGGSATAANQIVKQIVVKPVREAKEEGYNEGVKDATKTEADLVNDESTVGDVSENVSSAQTTLFSINKKGTNDENIK